MHLLTANYWIRLLSSLTDEDKINELKIYDRETILLTPIIISQISNHFTNQKNFRISNWFLDYSINTENVRIIYFSKDEHTKISTLAIEKNVSYDEASNYYINQYFGATIVR